MVPGHREPGPVCLVPSQAWGVGSLRDPTGRSTEEGFASTIGAQTLDVPMEVGTTILERCLLLQSRFHRREREDIVVPTRRLGGRSRVASHSAGPSKNPERDTGRRLLPRSRTSRLRRSWLPPICFAMKEPLDWWHSPLNPRGRKGDLPSEVQRPLTSSPSLPP